MLTRQKIPSLALRKILSSFVLGKIIKIEPLATSGNITYIIWAGGHKYLLRLAPLGPRWRSREEILAEIELLNYLADNKFPVIRPVKNKSGETLIVWQKHYGYLRKFSSGREKLKPAITEVRKFGEVLGRFHKLIENYKTKNQREHLWTPLATKKYFLEIKKDLDREFADQFWLEFKKLKFPKVLPSGSIHEDLGRRHVLWQKGKIVAILDFDRFYFGPLIFDLGQAIRGWCFTNNWQKWSQANFQALLSAYQKQRKLADLEKKYLGDSIRFAILERALSFYIRYQRVTHDPEDRDYAWLSLNKLIAGVRHQGV